MKKFAFAAVVALAFVACQKKEEAAPAVDSTAVAPVAVDSAKDTTKVDSAAAAVVDTAKKDSVKK